MKPIIVLIMSSGLMLQACEQAPVRRAEMLAEHSGWGNEAAQLIKAAYLLALKARLTAKSRLCPLIPRLLVR